MDEKEMLREYSKELIEHAKKIATYCNKHSECNERCIFYTGCGNHVCIFNSDNVPCRWDFSVIEED